MNFRGPLACFPERNPYEIFSLIDILRPIFKQYDVKSAVLFGSVAKGSANEHSNIDLLVDSRLEGFKFCGLANKIEEADNKPVDLFDVTHVEKGSLLDEEIKTHGILIYEDTR